jgi:hypothetical protein
MVKKWNLNRILAGKTQGKRPLGRNRHRWEIDVQMDLRVKEFSGMNLIHLSQDTDKWRAL